MAFKKVAVTLVNIRCNDSGTDPGPDLEIYGDLYVSKNKKREVVQKELMWHKNSTDRIVLNEGDSHYVNVRKDFILQNDSALTFHGNTMYEHDSFPNPDDTFTDCTHSLAFRDIKNEELSLGFLEDVDDLIPSRDDKEHFSAHYKIEVVPVQHEPYGAILDKWERIFRFIGDPVDIERFTFDGVGRSQPFQAGIISWHRDIGDTAFGVWGSIGKRWLELGREAGFGYPITDELTTPDGRGRFNHFRKLHVTGKPEASIYWSPDTRVDAIEIYGVIRDKWAELGWERSRLGYPITKELNLDGGRIQHFQNGSISLVNGQLIVKIK